jgi:hypothetical protein
LRWINLFRDSIMAPLHEAAPLPPLDPHACRFGIWLDSTGLDRYGHLPGFAVLARAHEAVHRTGNEIDHLARNDRKAARESLGSLLDKRDTLLDALARLRSEALAI